MTFWLDEAALAGWQAPPYYTRRSAALLRPGDRAGADASARSPPCLAPGRGLRRHHAAAAVDATTGEIAAHVLTGGHADDAAQAPDLLRHAKDRITSVTADGAYDREPVYQAAAARQHEQPPDVIILVMFG